MTLGTTKVLTSKLKEIHFNETTVTKEGSGQASTEIGRKASQRIRAIMGAFARDRVANRRIVSLASLNCQSSWHAGFEIQSNDATLNL